LLGVRYVISSLLFQNPMAEHMGEFDPSGLSQNKI
jgi:hypothetical protein